MLFLPRDEFDGQPHYMQILACFYRMEFWLEFCVYLVTWESRVKRLGFGLLLNPDFIVANWIKSVEYRLLICKLQ